MRVRLAIWMAMFAASLAAAGCALSGGHNLPPSPRLAEPGPGVGGPGPGVIAPASCPGPMMYGGGPVAYASSAQILFARPEGMQVRWDIGGVGQFDSLPLITPGRFNFPQGAIYRLKLTNVPGREGVELYPTIELGLNTPRSQAFLAHNAIPVQFTEEDFDQVLSGNFVTKVIYLPDPEFQELALAGVETLVSTRLDPGVDPIVEADRRGAILAIVRLGNKDMEMPGIDLEDGSVVHASYLSAASMMEASAGAGPRGGCSNVNYGPYMGGPMTIPPAYVAGVTAPQYGMPYSGTPIGLPGPPHVPLGIPAGLQKHVMHNHTSIHLPPPTKKVGITVKQQPGFSYPHPADKAYILDQTIRPSPYFQQPHGNKYEFVH
jgi:hypothetical protein